MIEKTAVVIRINQGYAWVKSEGMSSCGSCSSAGGCSSTSLMNPNKESNAMQVANPFHAKPGDHVIVGMPSDGLLKSSLLAYLLPLFSLLVFAVLGREIFSLIADNGEIGAILMGVGGLFVGLRFSDTLAQHSDIKEKLQPVILRKDARVNEILVDFGSPAT